MPILSKEVDLFPSDLLDRLEIQTIGLTTNWYALYTVSRREKQLMRKLLQLNIAFYGPVIERRYRSPNGRVRTSYQPLFSNYVFVHGDCGQRYASLTTNCVSRCYEVPNGRELVEDLRSIKR